ncbi:hypothetical protein [Streptacidiphilus melanogenes]|uniref:hypothetical protein n=1 Tax=Streptacidiphilus melanogenes TaxID=411235 RepID=UPI00126A4F48|nr:hypothetical protein [Streptacidiphilus melanogenes]
MTGSVPDGEGPPPALAGSHLPRLRAAGDAMTDLTVHPITAQCELPDGSALEVTISSQQLHGRACVRCESHLDGLVSAGHVHTPNGDGGRLGWPVKACPEHAGPVEAAA